MSTIDREKPRMRGSGKPIGWQDWRELLFVHWETDPGELENRLPPGLKLDLWNGRALVGAVPFRMENVRPWWLPKPFAQTFLELNLRIYVVSETGEPGVLFLSLDAASWTAVNAARAGWSLPYFHAQMSVTRTGNQVGYESLRRAHPANFQCEYSIGRQLPQPSVGSIEFFLLERYLLFVEHRGQLFRGHVHHVPYPVHEVELTSISESLIGAAGLSRGELVCTHYSPGVEVEVLSLRKVERRVKT
jgi:uncharacterized protein YqjF (DUF2071 family)